MFWLSAFLLWCVFFFFFVDLVAFIILDIHCASWMYVLVFSSNLKIFSLYFFEKNFFFCPILSCLSSGTSVACKFVYFMGSLISLKLFSFSFFTPFIFWIANNNGLYSNLGFPGGSDSKESSCNVWDLGWEDPLEEGMLTHSSILAWRIPMDRGAWWATVHGVAKSQTRLND